MSEEGKIFGFIYLLYYYHNLIYYNFMEFILLHNR